MMIWFDAKAIGIAVIIISFAVILIWFAKILLVFIAVLIIFKVILPRVCCNPELGLDNPIRIAAKLMVFSANLHNFVSILIAFFIYKDIISDEAIAKKLF